MNERQKRMARLVGEAERLEWRLSEAIWRLDDRQISHPQRDRLKRALAKVGARYDRRERALLAALLWALREGAAA